MRKKLGHIPDTEFIKLSPLDRLEFVTEELFKKYHTTSDWNKFAKWMRGQTCMLLDGNISGFYSWDYRRWLNNLKPITQGEDWD